MQTKVIDIKQNGKLLYENYEARAWNIHHSLHFERNKIQNQIKKRTKPEMPLHTLARR